MLARATLLLCSMLASEAYAQCERSCALGQARDPYGCCIPSPRGGEGTRRPRRAPSLQAESLVGDGASVLANDTATELYLWARAWLARARSIDATSHARAVPLFRQAAGASLVFLTLAPADPRAGRMRVILVQGLDGAGLVEEGEREAAALGGPRPADEPAALRTMCADLMLNLAWGHHAVAGRLDSSRYAAQRERARARYRRASDYFALFVATFPSLPEAAGAQRELASTLIGAGELDAAARAFEALAASAPTQARRIEALRGTIDAYQRALARDVQSGRTVLRAEPPEPSQRPPWAAPLAFPPELQRLFDARELYLRETASAPEALWRGQELENVLWLYRYGRWDDAERRLSSLLVERCDDGVARNAWTILASMRPAPRTSAPTVAELCSVQRRARCARAPDTPECIALRDASARSE